MIWKALLAILVVAVLFGFGVDIYFRARTGSTCNGIVIESFNGPAFDRYVCLEKSES